MIGTGRVLKLSFGAAGKRRVRLVVIDSRVRSATNVRTIAVKKRSRARHSRGKST